MISNVENTTSPVCQPPADCTILEGGGEIGAKALLEGEGDIVINPLLGQEGGVKHETTIFAEPIFHIGSLTVTNSLLSGWIATILIVMLGLAIRRNLKQIPGKLQAIFEMVVEGALGVCDQVTNDRKKSEKIFPFAITVFFFILINNYLGLLPGVGSIGFIESHEAQRIFVPLFRGGTADINTTLALSIFTVIAANIFGIVSIGLWKSFNKYVNLKALWKGFTNLRKDPTGIIVGPITFFVGILEVIGEVAKVASLSFRLFGNIFAGEVLLVAMSSLSQFFLPIPFLFLEVGVGMIQAFIFSMLTVVYFTIASTDHDEHDEHAPASAESYGEAKEGAEVILTTR